MVVMDIKFALDPPVGPEAPPSDANVDAYREYERANRYREWAKQQMFSKNREMLPPPDCIEECVMVVISISTSNR
jgi:hypothetical protein